MARAAIVGGLVLILSACAQAISEQPTNSPEASPSTPAVITSPTTEPTSSPPAETSPSPKASPIPAKLIIKSLPFHIGEVGVTYGTVTLVAAGGVKPYKWSISSGAFPSGLALSSGGKATGKPTAPGTFSFVVRVDDSAGSAAGVSRSVFVFRQIYFTKAQATCLGSYLTGCKTTLTYKGGASSATPKLKVTLRAGDPPLPTGSTVTAKGGVVTVNIAPQCNSYSGVITVVLLDQSPCTTGYICSSAPATVDITLTSAC